MYAKFSKENHAEMHGAKLETFNEAKVIFHQWENVFAADQRTSMLAVLLECCDAPQRRSGLRQDRDTRIWQTIVAWSPQVVISLVSSQSIAESHAFWQCVFLTGLEVFQSRTFPKFFGLSYAFAFEKNNVKGPGEAKETAG